jgi:hypothetical protein
VLSVVNDLQVPREFALFSSTCSAIPKLPQELVDYVIDQLGIELLNDCIDDRPVLSALQRAAAFRRA